MKVVVNEQKDSKGETTALSIDDNWLPRKGPAFLSSANQLSDVSFADLSKGVEFALDPMDVVNKMKVVNDGTAEVTFLYSVCCHCMEEHSINAGRYWAAAQKFLRMEAQNNPNVVIHAVRVSEDYNGLEVDAAVHGVTCGDVFGEVVELTDSVADRMNEVDALVDSLIDKQLNS